MNITIKNVKHIASMSQETPCFQAVVYVDGKRAFGVDNDGHGGCNRYYHLKAGAPGNVYEEVHRINEVLSETPVEGHPDLPNDLDIVIGDLLEDHLWEQETKKVLKRISYVRDGKLYQLPTKYKPTEANLKGVKQSGWWKESYVMLNDLPFNEAVTTFRKVG